MATIPPKILCDLSAESSRLRFPPPSGGILISAAHRGALKAQNNKLNQFILANDGVLKWAGALDEMHITAKEASDIDARQLICDCIKDSNNPFLFITPGVLQNGFNQKNDTTYRGSRPWLAIAENEHLGYLAVPLNDADGITKWWEHPLPALSLPTENAKDSKIGLNHLWSFPNDTPAIGNLHSDYNQAVIDAVIKYYS